MILILGLILMIVILVLRLVLRASNCSGSNPITAGRILSLMRCTGTTPILPRYYHILLWYYHIVQRYYHILLRYHSIMMMIFLILKPRIGITLCTMCKYWLNIRLEGDVLEQ